MDKTYIILDNGESFLVDSYKKLTKSKYKLYGKFDDGTTGYVLVSFPVWTLSHKRYSFKKLLDTRYVVLEVHRDT